MKKALALLLVLAMVFSLAACGNTNANNTPPAGDNTQAPSTDNTDAPANLESGTFDPTGKKIGFVTFGPGEFFTLLADTYVETFKALGWDASYTDGEFNPETQISAAENYIAMGVDVLVIWAVVPEAMTGVVQQAMEKGIKVISFVAELPQYDVLMLSDDARLAGNLAKLAAQWIDETYADADDHSVPVAVLSCRAADTGVLQADVLLKIEEYSKKAKFAGEFEQSDESATTGQTAAENIYTTNPEIKVFLTPHSGLGNGIASFYTSLSSPVTDYSDMGIFSINGDNTTVDSIKASTEGKSPNRGTVMTGSVQDTANELLEYVTAIMDGSIESGYVRYAGTLFVYADTVDEYLTTGTVTSVTEEDFPG